MLWWRRSIAEMTAIAFLGSLTACTDFDGLTVPVGDAGARDGPSEAASPDGGDASCGAAHEYPFNGHCYLFEPNDRAWHEAESECVSWGGHLVSIGGAEEQAFVRNVVAKEIVPASTSSGIWIGLNDLATAGTFVWITGEPLDYTSWGPSNPDTVPGHDCVFEYLNFNGNWDNFLCTVSGKFLCER